jgi:hypothetical protein
MQLYTAQQLHMLSLNQSVITATYELRPCVRNVKLCSPEETTEQIARNGAQTGETPASPVSGALSNDLPILRSRILRNTALDSCFEWT